MVTRMSNTKRPSRTTPLPKKTTSRTPKGTQVIIAVIAIICIAGVIAIPFLLKGGNKDDNASPTAASHPSPTSVDDVVCDSVPNAPANAKQFDSAPPSSLAENTTWTAVVHTTGGDIRIELDGKAAPQTVASFISLARNGYWDDGPCHRLTTAGIYVLQCGDPTGTGTGSPGYGFGIENAPDNGDYPRGTLAMARGSDPNTNGGQWFIVYKDSQLPTQGGGYSIFGKVTEGMDIVDAIAAKGGANNSSDGAPSQPISILSVNVEKA